MLQKWLQELLKNQTATVYLLHMIELPTGVVDMGAGSNFSIPESMLYLRKVKERVLKFKETFFTEEIDVHHSIGFKIPLKVL